MCADLTITILSSPELGDVFGCLPRVRLGEVEAVEAAGGACVVHHVGVVQHGGEHAGQDKVCPGAGGHHHLSLPHPGEGHPGAQQGRPVGEHEPGQPDPPHKAAGTRAEMASQFESSKRKF